MNGVPGAIGNTAAHLPPTALRSRTTVRHRLSSRWHVGAERFKQFFMLPDCYRRIRAEKGFLPERIVMFPASSRPSFQAARMSARPSRPTSNADMTTARSASR